MALFDDIDDPKNGGGLMQYSVADSRNGIGPDGSLGCSPTNIVDGCDKGANRYALAMGFNYLLTPNATFKAEYRIDHASVPAFVNVLDGIFTKTNRLLGTSVVVSF